jgi:hypothetical protein
MPGGLLFVREIRNNDEENDGDPEQEAEHLTTGRRDKT